MDHLEEKVKAYHEIAHEVRRLESKKKELSGEILALIPEHEKNLLIGEFRVKKFQTFSIKTSLETARLFDAVKTEEIVDRAKIKSLFLQGEMIPDVTSGCYIQVSKKLSSATCNEEVLACNPGSII